MQDSEAQHQRMAYDRLRAAADALPESIGRYIDALGPERRPRSDSAAARDSKTLSFRDAVETISSQADLLFEAAGDYHFAVVRLLQEPSLTVAPYGAARGVLEASSQVLWLMEPDIEPHTRLGRSLSLRHAGLRDQANILRALGDQQGRLMVASRARELANIARSRGIQVTYRKNGAISTIGPGLPPSTALVATYLGGERFWRVLSSVAHSQATSVMTSSFRLASRNTLEKHISADAAATLMTRSARWFSRAAWAYLDYSGWITPNVTEILESAFDHMLLAENERFWRGAVAR
jgi:hypothetical protein